MLIRPRGVPGGRPRSFLMRCTNHASIVLASFTGAIADDFTHTVGPAPKFCAGPYVALFSVGPAYISGWTPKKRGTPSATRINCADLPVAWSKSFPLVISPVAGLKLPGTVPEAGSPSELTENRFTP